MGFLSKLAKAVVNDALNSSKNSVKQAAEPYRETFDAIEDGYLFPKGLLYLTPCNTVYPDKRTSHTCYVFTDQRSHESLTQVIDMLNGLIDEASSYVGFELLRITEAQCAVPSMGIVTNGEFGSPWAFTRAEYKPVTSSGNPNKTPMKLIFSSAYGVIEGLVEANVKFDKDGETKGGRITEHVSSYETIVINISSKKNVPFVSNVVLQNARNESASTILYDKDNAISKTQDKKQNCEADLETNNDIQQFKADCSKFLHQYVNSAKMHCSDVPGVEEFLASDVWEKHVSCIVEDNIKTKTGKPAKYVKETRLTAGNNTNGGEEYIVELYYRADGTMDKGRYIHWLNRKATMVEFGDAILKRVSVSSDSGWDRVFDYNG